MTTELTLIILLERVALFCSPHGWRGHWLYSGDMDIVTTSDWICVGTDDFWTWTTSNKDEFDCEGMNGHWEYCPGGE